MMAAGQQFCLRWNNFQANIASQFEALRNEENFVDVTLACSGHKINAHKVVLSACSPYFKELLSANPCKHPILVLTDVDFGHLQALVEFMYLGEVNVAQNDISSFLHTARSLQVRGLTETPNNYKGSGSETVGSSPPLEKPGSKRQISSSSRLAGQNIKELEQDNNEIETLSDGSQSSKKFCSPQSSASNKTQESQENTSHYQNEFSCDMVDPKTETPDYSSDGEVRYEGNNFPGSYLGFDNSGDINLAYSSLQGGGWDFMGNFSSHNFNSDTPHEATQADPRKLHSLDPRPCPICYRMYSNLSNLRQHVRLIHNPQTVACPLCGKPFKTKLYLKRHLVSFHELTTSSAVGPPKDYIQAQLAYLGSAFEKRFEAKSEFQNLAQRVKSKDIQAQLAEMFPSMQNIGAEVMSNGMRSENHDSSIKEEQHESNASSSNFCRMPQSYPQLDSRNGDNNRTASDTFTSFSNNQEDNSFVDTVHPEKEQNVCQKVSRNISDNFNDQTVMTSIDRNLSEEFMSNNNRQTINNFLDDSTESSKQNADQQ